MKPNKSDVVAHILGVHQVIAVHICCSVAKVTAHHHHAAAIRGGELVMLEESNPRRRGGFQHTSPAGYCIWFNFLASKFGLGFRPHAGVSVED